MKPKRSRENIIEMNLKARDGIDFSSLWMGTSSGLLTRLGGNACFHK